MADNSVFLGDKPTALDDEGGYLVGKDASGKIRLLPIGDAEDIDNAIPGKVPSVAGVKCALDVLEESLSAQIEGAAAGILAFRTWPELASVTGAIGGQQAKVTSDNSSHIDPVNGDTVDNGGSYRWSVSPAGWEWTGPLIDGDSVAVIAAEIQQARGGQVSLDARLDSIDTSVAQKATAEQGAKADTALQAGAGIDQLSDTSGFKRMTAVERTKLAGLPSAAATAVQGGKADTAMQPSTYDPIGLGGDVFAETISVTQYGATLSALQTPDQRADCIQNALVAGAFLGRYVFLPKGVWSIGKGLKVLDKTRFIGAGKGVSVLQFSTTVGTDPTILTPIAYDMSIGGVFVANMTLDGNRAARIVAGSVPADGAAGAEGTERPCGSGWASMSAHDCAFYRVESISHVLHCFDDCAGGDVVAGKRRYCYPEGPTLYSTTPSRRNVYIECEASDWSDDGFTTHYDIDATFIRCRGVGASDHSGTAAVTDDEGGTSKAIAGSNAFEADDGTLGARFIDCYGAYSAGGFLAKGHSGCPAASDVIFENCLAEYVNQGFNIYNSAGQGNGVGEDCTLINPKVRNPINYHNCDRTMGGIRVAAYNNVKIIGAHIENKLGVMAKPSNGIMVSSVCKNIIIDDFHIINWPGSNNVDADLAAIRVTPESIVSIGQGEIINPGLRGIRWSGTQSSNRMVGPVRLTQDTPVSGSIAFESTGKPTSSLIQIATAGFDFGASLGGVTYANGTLLFQNGNQFGAAERGSNANGEYTKYPDGTMLAWGTSSFVFGASDVAITTSVTFPVAFSVAPNVQATMNRASTTIATSDFNVWVGSPTASATDLYMRNNQSPSAQTRTVSWQAVGRWF